MRAALNLTTVCDVIDYMNEYVKTDAEHGLWGMGSVVFYLHNVNLSAEWTMCHDA